MPYQLPHDRSDLMSSSTTPMKMNKSSSSLEVDRSMYSSPWSKSSSYPPISLSHSHVEDALSASEDNGATLIFMKKGLTDIGLAAAEELATIGNRSDEESYVERYVAFMPA